MLSKIGPNLDQYSGLKLIWMQKRFFRIKYLIGSNGFISTLLRAAELYFEVGNPYTYIPSYDNFFDSNEKFSVLITLK